MSKSKKGISPLIATVLILGLTVVLAALVAMWSTQFTKDTTKSVTESAEIQTRCARDVRLDIKSACNAGGGIYKIVLENNGNQAIFGLKVRLFQNDNTVDSKSVNPNPNPLPAFGVQQITIPATTILAAVKRIEILPSIAISANNYVTCPSMTSYGETTGTDITTAC